MILVLFSLSYDIHEMFSTFYYHTIIIALLYEALEFLCS